MTTNHYYNPVEAEGRALAAAGRALLESTPCPNGHAPAGAHCHPELEPGGGWCGARVHAAGLGRPNRRASRGPGGAR